MNIYKKRIIILFISLLFVALPILKYESLHSTYYDLGVYANHLYEWTLDRGVVVGNHVNLFLPIFSVFYKLIPQQFSTDFLLLVQSIGLLCSAYLVRRMYGEKVFFIYSLSFPFWLLNLFDFHFEFIAIIFLLLFFKSLRSENFWSATGCAILLCFVKESYALTSLFCGIYMFLDISITTKVDRRKNLVLAGFTVIVFSAIYFAFSHFLIYEKVDTVIEVSQASHDGILFKIYHTMLGIVSNLDGLDSIFDFSKWLFMILPLAAFGFVPIFGAKALLICIPTLSIAFFSPNPLHHKFNSHYVAIMLPVLSEAFYLALLKFDVSTRYGRIFNSNVVFLPGCAFLTLIVLSVLTNYTWAFGMMTFIPSVRDNNIKQALYSELMSNSTLSIAVQNSINYFPIYNRNNVGPIVFWNKSSDQSMLPDYIVYDLKRPLFLDDKSCSWRFDVCNDLNFVNTFETNLIDVSKFYETKIEFDGFFILKKREFTN